LFSSWFFWYMVMITGGWFVFYKMQASVFCMIPLEEEKFTTPYEVMMTMLLVVKVIDMLYKIFN